MIADVLTVASNLSKGLDPEADLVAREISNIGRSMSIVLKV